MTKQKTKILTTVFGTLILVMSTGFALVVKADVGYIDISETPTVNVGTNNRVKICRDVTCDNPGIINFEISGESPFVIDTENGLSGQVWGDELGWITFNPPYGGVFMVDTETGLLQGTAWSETSGAINFSVTGQKVVIDPKTGEWNGWAWASGPYGGWIKFDCGDASCVRTTWSSQTSQDVQPSQKFSFLKNLFNQIIDFKYQLFSTIGQKFSNTYNSVAVFLADIFTQNSLVNKNEPAISPTSPIPNVGENKKENPVLVKTKFDEVYDSIVLNLDEIQKPTTEIETQVEVLPPSTDIQSPIEASPTPSLGEKIKVVVQEKSEIMSDNFNVLVAESTDLFKKMTTTKDKMFDKAGDSYYTFSSNLINLKGSVLEALNNLIK